MGVRTSESESPCGICGVTHIRRAPSLPPPSRLKHATVCSTPSSSGECRFAAKRQAPLGCMAISLSARLLLALLEEYNRCQIAGINDRAAYPAPESSRKLSGSISSDCIAESLPSLRMT